MREYYSVRIRSINVLGIDKPWNEVADLLLNCILKTRSEKSLEVEILKTLVNSISELLSNINALTRYLNGGSMQRYNIAVINTVQKAVDIYNDVRFVLEDTLRKYLTKDNPDLYLVRKLFSVRAHLPNMIRSIQDADIWNDEANTLLDILLH